ncbi:MAG: DUF4416 domain-containing protein, partial [Planctomycetia bacterium]|nr:DUF4416 domain-containing protein [Planctomycetia bacterium]
MAQPKPYSPQLLLLAAFSRHDEALAWAKQKAQNAWGSIALDSGPFPFDDTD